jgi:magnesium chelatase family protein
VEAVPPAQLVGDRGKRQTPSAEVRDRVFAARERQNSRLAGTGALCNGDMDARLTRQQVPLDAVLARRLLAVQGTAGLSGRAHDRILRVARTIGDLAGRDRITGTDLDEALSYRLNAWEAVAA